MGRSKEMGKPVEELSIDELLGERSRCQKFLDRGGHREAEKHILLRLRKIEERLATESG